MPVRHSQCIISFTNSTYNVKILSNISQNSENKKRQVYNKENKMKERIL